MIGARTLRQLVAAILLAIGLLPALAVAQSSPSAFTKATRYDIEDRVVGTIAPDPGGSLALPYAAVRNTYDANGRLIRVEKGALSSWQSDTTAPSAWPAWNAAAGTGFKVFTKVETTYDALDRKTFDVLSGWDDATSAWVTTSVTQYSYDPVGRLECTAIRMNPATWGGLPGSACILATTSPTNGPDRITRNEYDDGGRLTKVIKGFGQTSANGLEPLQQDYSTYTYTWDSKAATVKDADGNLTSYTYDGFDRLIAWTFPSKATVGSSAPCTVGATGENTENFTGPTGAVSVQVAGPAGSTAGDDCEKYAYDRNGNRVKLIKRDGAIIKYTFDNLNRNVVKTVSNATVADTFYSYDARGLQTSARFLSVSGVGVINTYTGFGELSGTTNTMDGTSRTLAYLYDPDGNRIRITYPDTVYFTSDYDGLDRLTTIKESGTNTLVSTTFDTAGRIASQSRGMVTSTLVYDAVSRPKSWTDNLPETPPNPTSDVTTTLSYNYASQIVAKGRNNNAYAYPDYTAKGLTYSVNGLNQYTSVGVNPYTYDVNGNLTSDGGNSYGYDAENRMSSAVVAGTTYNIQYDPLGRLWRINRGVNGGQWQYLYDGDAMVVRYNVAINGGGIGFNMRYVHGPNEDDPLIQYSSASLANPMALQADYEGSIVSAVDASGALVGIKAYDEYGIVSSTFGGIQPEFGYTGQLYLGQIGLYYYKARMYSPMLGRFMQTDPIGYKDQINLYAYVGNDPIDIRDPTGLAGGPGGSNGWLPEHFIEEIVEVGEEAGEGVKFGLGGLLIAGELLVTPSAAGPTGGTKLTVDTINRLVSKVDGRENVVNDKHISAALQEARGGVVKINPKDGEPFDHINELREAQNGLGKDIVKMKGMFKYSMSEGTAMKLVNSISKASKLLDKVNRVLQKIDAICVKSKAC